MQMQRETDLVRLMTEELALKAEIDAMQADLAAGNATEAVKETEAKSSEAGQPAEQQRNKRPAEDADEDTSRGEDTKLEQLRKVILDTVEGRDWFLFESAEMSVAISDALQNCEHEKSFDEVGPNCPFPEGCRVIVEGAKTKDDVVKHLEHPPV